MILDSLLSVVSHCDGWTFQPGQVNSPGALSAEFGSEGGVKAPPSGGGAPAPCTPGPCREPAWGVLLPPGREKRLWRFADWPGETARVWHGELGTGVATGSDPALPEASMPAAQGTGVSLVIDSAV